MRPYANSVYAALSCAVPVAGASGHHARALLLLARVKAPHPCSKQGATKYVSAYCYVCVLVLLNTRESALPPKKYIQKKNKIKKNKYEGERTAARSRRGAATVK